MGFPDGSSVKNPPAMQETQKMQAQSEQRRSPGEGNGNSLQYSCLGVGDGQGGLVCCDSWGRKESDMTEHACTRYLTTCSSTAQGTLLSTL